jgi:hypothetical protein
MTIGPKCQACGKQRKYHHYQTLHCPVGKRQRDVGYCNGYVVHHPTNRFTPREKSRGGASEKRKDRKTRMAVKAEPCIVCGAKGCDPCHIKTFGASQSDHPDNLLPMCRKHHAEQHRLMWGRFIEKHPVVLIALIEKGWDVTRHPFDHSRVVLSHKEFA